MIGGPHKSRKVDSPTIELADSPSYGTNKAPQTQADNEDGIDGKRKKHARLFQF